MNERLTPEAEEKLRALARKISMANELAPDLQEELYGHLEDKALGYLSGDEAVSVDDAVLLTREHFGDPRMLKSWLSSVHTREAAIGTSRRLAAMAILILATSIAVKATYFFLDEAIYNSASVSSMRLYWYTHYLNPISLVGLACSLWIARQWRQRETRGEMPWYARWTGHTFGIALVLLLAGQCAIPLTAPDQSLRAALRPDNVPPGYYFMFVEPLLGLLWPMLWLWWADRRPYRLRACAKGLGAFFLLRMVSIESSMLVGMPRIVMGGPELWRLEPRPNSTLSGGEWIHHMTHYIWLDGMRLAEISAQALAVYAVARLLQYAVRSRTQRPA